MIRTSCIAFFVLFLIGNIQLSAQCVDSSLIQYGGACDPHYDPVCACNGTTYQNDCFARIAGIQTYNFYYGICGEVDFDFNPNPAYDLVNVDAILKYQGDMYIQVMDRFGKVYYSTVFSNVLRYQFQLDVRGMPAGIYYINIFCATGNKVKKLVVPGLL